MLQFVTTHSSAGQIYPKPPPIQHCTLHPCATIDAPPHCTIAYSTHLRAALFDAFIGILVSGIALLIRFKQIPCPFCSAHFRRYRYLVNLFSSLKINTLQAPTVHEQR
jgi:hypothetical protein